MISSAQMPSSSAAAQRRITVCVCVDPGALVGLHVTLHSALRNLAADAMLDLRILQYGLTATHIDDLRRTLDALGRRYEMQSIPVTDDRFRGMKWLGGWMTYVRLLIPELVAEKRAVYIDADLIVNADLAELFDHPLGEHILGAVTWGPIELSNDFAFFKGLGVDTAAPYFNGGVLLMDLDGWRERDVLTRCLAFGDAHQTRLPSADQTILNHVFLHAFTAVPRRFNTPVTASAGVVPADQRPNRVIHMVARPKPWDLFGSLNGQAALFKAELRQTHFAHYRPPLTGRTIKTCLRLSGAYWKCLKARVRDLASPRSASEAAS